MNILLPKDISQRIEQTFSSLVEREYVTSQLNSLWAMDLNVGADQLARCILILTDGKFEIFREIFNTNFYGDPRDLIMNAMEKSGNKTHWGINKLDNK